MEACQRAAAIGLNLYWFAENMLGATALAAYDAAGVPAWAAYQAARATALAAYQAARATALWDALQI